MARLNLTNQQAAVDQIQPYLNALKTRLDNRKAIWDRLPRHKQKQWILSGKDPIMTLAWTMYKYLHKNFFEKAYDEAED